MNSTLPHRRQLRPAGLLGFALLAYALLYFVRGRVHYVADYSLASYTDYYWVRRGGLVLHLLGGTLAILTGLAQLWLGLTGRTGQAHRLTGRVYVAGVLCGVAGGLYLSLTIPGHFAYAGGLLGLAVAWAITTGMAVYAIRERRLEQHRDWMMRSYICTFAFVSYRLASKLVSPYLQLADDPVASELDILLAWGCWAVPLLLAEPLIQLRHIRRPRG